DDDEPTPDPVGGVQQHQVFIGDDDPHVYLERVLSLQYIIIDEYIDLASKTQLLKDVDEHAIALPQSQRNVTLQLLRAAVRGSIRNMVRMAKADVKAADARAAQAAAASASRKRPRGVSFGTRLSSGISRSLVGQSRVPRGISGISRAPAKRRKPNPKPKANQVSVHLAFRLWSRPHATETMCVLCVHLL
ncbi:MAG: hypothetical protein GY826_03515, partial [Fuerstiella sp.]|nr:hypothetical protein [Fuerstiella sp.]